MTIEEQFSEIILKTKGKEFFPFLKALSPADKKLLASPIKKLTKEYTEFGNIEGNTWGNIKGTDKQRNMLQIASFVCHNRVDYEKSQFSLWFLHKEQLKDIITWYVPDWFSDYVNKEGSGDNFSLEYDWIIQLMEMGALQPSPELLVNSIPAILYEHKDKQWHYQFDNLLKYPITLQEHIWCLFDYPSNLHYSNRFLYFGKDVSKEKQDWQHAFETLAKEGHLDRQRLLKESLLAGNKNFNKILSGWFADLFIKLEPGTAELLALQKELVMVMNAQHSKPATVVLQYLKKIIAEKDMDINAILDALPVVLSSSTKNLVNTALLLMEQIAKKEKVYWATIAQLCCQVFIHHDEALQNRAAKIIEKYGDKQDEIIKTQLATYSDGLLQSSRKILESFLEAPSEEKEVEISFPGTDEAVSPVYATEPIPAVETIDDLLFLAAQAFDNNASWHFDRLPAALVRMQQQLKGPVLSQLQPALQQALKVSRGVLRSTQGFYDHMLSIFFIDVCVHLVRKHPADAANLQKVFDSFDAKKTGRIENCMLIKEGQSYISTWSNEFNDPYYLPLKQLLIEALGKLWREDSLPLLSTPTHQPGWIAPGILIDRLAEYRQRSVEPGATDMQLAIARCALTDTKDAIAMAKQKLTGEWQRLILFLLEPGAEPVAPFSQREAWMMASLSKHPKKKYAAFESFGFYKDGFEKYTGQFGWSVVIEELDLRDYAAGLGMSIEHTTSYKLLQLDLPPADLISEDYDPSGLLNRNRAKKKSKPVPAGTGPSLLYDFFRIKSQYLTQEPNDIRRALLMAPNNTEVFLSKVLHHCLGRPAYTSEGDKKMVIAVLQLLHELWDQPGGMSHLLVANCMLSADKTSSGIAAEIWLKYAPLGKIDNAMLGRMIGQQEKIEFAPLKRFTDLIMQSLFRVSVTHNRMLQEVVENTLAELPDTPIKNLKKLLEILTELMAVNKQPLEDKRVRERLTVWKETEGLKKVVEGIK